MKETRNGNEKGESDERCVTGEKVEICIRKKKLKRTK